MATASRLKATHWYELDNDALKDRADRSMSALPRPVVRWAGSKQRLLPGILDVLPDRFSTYFEPFFGSGALFFLLRPTQAVLTDACAPLMEVYQAIETEHRAVHTLLQNYDPLDRDMYYRVRSEIPGTPAARAARFIYLNRACWNGLYRVNKQGRFNVPYGAPKTATLPDLELLVACAQALKPGRVRIRVSDFAESVADARSGDLVFFDPPYVTGHNNNGFVDYNEDLFSWADQERLAATARRLRERGVHVVVTNADHDAIRDLYADFSFRTISRNSTLANNKDFRRPVTEALIYTKS